VSQIVSFVGPRPTSGGTHELGRCINEVADAVERGPPAHEHKVEIRQKAGLDSSNCKGEVSTTAGVAVLADTVVGRVKGWSQIMVQPE
jgi:hypothetical protein